MDPEINSITDFRNGISLYTLFFGTLPQLSGLTCEVYRSLVFFFSKIVTGCSFALGITKSTISELPFCLTPHYSVPNPSSAADFNHDKLTPGEIFATHWIWSMNRRKTDWPPGLSIRYHRILTTNNRGNRNRFLHCKRAAPRTKGSIRNASKHPLPQVKK